MRNYGMSPRRTPPRPEGAQTNTEEWQRFSEYFGHAKVRRIVRVISHLPSPRAVKRVRTRSAGPAAG